MNQRTDWADAIEIEGLKKAYQNGKVVTEVLKGISLQVKSGEFVSIAGPSGCGKSTLLYVLGGLEPYNSGSVKLFGKELKEYSNREKARLRSEEIGFVFQFYNLIPNLTVYENVLLASVLGKGAAKAEILSILDQVGMKADMHKFPSELSGGQQQRTAIARSLINNPKIIFADEPIGNLDYKNGIMIMELFSFLHKSAGKTIVMVTHNLDAAKYGNRIIHLLDGRVTDDEKL